MGSQPRANRSPVLQRPEQAMQDEERFTPAISLKMQIHLRLILELRGIRGQRSGRCRMQREPAF
jgi:hypothetical protein